MFNGTTDYKGVYARRIKRITVKPPLIMIMNNLNKGGIVK
jgi:hypothetical protein